MGQAAKQGGSVLAKERKILLMGPPNVGKSVFFSHLTNVHVISSNYTGTTVSFMEGTYRAGEIPYTLIDVPGTYSLAATSPAEEVAVSFLRAGPDAVLFVLNAADLEGSVKLALEVMAYQVPVLFALNLTDVAERKGLKVSPAALERELHAPVFPTVAVKGQGIEPLRRALENLLEKKRYVASYFSRLEGGIGAQAELWARARTIAEKATERIDRRPNFLDRLGEAMLHPWPGLPLALLILAASLGFVAGGGELLREKLLLPLVDGVIVPLFEGLIVPLRLHPLLENILIGDRGVFRIGFEWIVALVMPYVLLFQVQFAFLEDSGVLPRLAVLFDGVMRKLGVQGGSLIQLFLGFGCAVPAIIATRAATTKKERLMVTAMICFAIPCTSQTGALLTLLTEYSAWLAVATVATGAAVFVCVAAVLGKVIKGKVEPLILEVPSLLIPEPKSYFKKLWVRIRQFLVEAEGPMLIAVFIAAVLSETGLLEGLGHVFRPVVSDWLGLPEGAVMSLILGIIRREMSVAPLLELQLTARQMYIGAVVSLLYLPCLSVFGIIAKEFNAKTAVAISAGTTATALFVGGAMNHIITLLERVFA